MRPGGRPIHSESFGSFVYALGVVGFIWRRWVYSGALCGSSGSLCVVGYIRVRSGDRWVHLGSLGPLGCALGVIGFIQYRWVGCRILSWSLG